MLQYMLFLMVHISGTCRGLIKGFEQNTCWHVCLDILLRKMSQPLLHCSLDVVVVLQ